MKNDYYNSERVMEMRFSKLGPCYHLCTQPISNGLLFRDDEDRLSCMNFIPIAACKADIVILVFVLMSNHLHFILLGTESSCMAFYNYLLEMLSNYFSRHGNPGITDGVMPTLVAITDIKQFRNETAYVLRNPFVARVDVNPLTYKWGSGNLYFNDFSVYREGVDVSSLSIAKRRNITKTREGEIPGGLKCLDGMIQTASYVDYRTVESLFRDTRSFLMNLFRNVEAQVETARRYNENPSLNDEEAFLVVIKLCQDIYNVKGPKFLLESQRCELATKLKYNYCMSNKQIARTACLGIEVVESMFPLSK